jgi:hypothetical protein
MYLFFFHTKLKEELWVPLSNDNKTTGVSVRSSFVFIFYKRKQEDA